MAVGKVPIRKGEEEEGSFAFEDEKLGKLTARVHVAGTYSIKQKTWMWEWANGDLHDGS